MSERKASEGIAIRLAGSKKHTLNSIAYALAFDRELSVENPYPNIDLDYYNHALLRNSYGIEYDNGILNIKKTSGNHDDVMPDQSFEIDDPIGLLLALKFGERIHFRAEQSEDFEREILILRRMGVRFTDNSNGYTVEKFEPVKIKFNFQESNFYLAEYIAFLTSLCNLETEFLAGIDVVSNLSQEIYPFTLAIENLNRNSGEEDELGRRMKKLKKTRKEKKHHYSLKRGNDDPSEKISLPADPLVGAMASVLALVTHVSPVKIGPLGQYENEKTFAYILAKFGAKAETIKIESEDFYSIESDKLIGRKIEENQMRIFPDAFGPLSVLASFASDKTILRGLPTSSSLWRARISGVAAILNSAGVRVGEIEDGFVIEPPGEFTDITYSDYDDPYLQLVQLAAAIAINTRPLTSEFFAAHKHYPQFQTCLDKIRPRAKSLAS